MKSRQQLAAHHDTGIGRRRTPGSVPQQISACVLPMLAAAAAAWLTFQSLDDWQISLVLGGTAFLTATPLTTGISGKQPGR